MDDNYAENFHVSLRTFLNVIHLNDNSKFSFLFLHLLRGLQRRVSGQLENLEIRLFAIRRIPGL